MKKLFFLLVWCLFISLAVVNLYTYITQMRFSEKYNVYEGKLKKIKQENMDLEQKAYEADSLKYAASMAAELDFTKKADLIYLENLRYAFKK